MKSIVKKAPPFLLIVVLLGFFLTAGDSMAGRITNSIGIPNATGIELFVSPNGDDTNEGTKKSPLKSLDAAKQRVRLLRKTNRNQPVTVYVGGGIYALDKPILFTPEDSGSVQAPVVYRAEDGAEPIFSGSRKLKNWKPIKDKQIMGRLNAAVRSKVFVTDLKEAGISDFGDPTDLGLRPELFCNKKLQTLARWPNDGLTTAGQVKGTTKLPPTYMSSRGTKEGDFEYLNNRQNRWAQEQDVRLEGYWYWDWSEQFQRVASIDTLSKTIHIKEPYHSYGYKDSLRYFGLNLLCEIDKPGEWYLDRNAGLLYWYPPVDVKPEKAQVSLSLFASPFMIEMQNCSNMSISGLSFEEGRGSALRIKGGRNCRVEACRIERFGRDGIHVEGGSGHGISGCLLRTLGCGGIKLSGGDRKKLIASGHSVENTVVEHFSLFKRTYEPAILLQGCGHQITHNRLRYSSSSALRLEGNDFLIEYNQISHVVNESDDQGGLDVFYNLSYQGNIVRYNHWSDISGGTLHGAAGVRLDDMISGFRIYGNVFERCGAKSFGAVQIHGGKDNLVENNLFFNCPSGVSFSVWKEKRWMQMLDSAKFQKLVYQDVDIRSAAYLGKYPALKDIRLNINVNKVVNNVLVDCKSTIKGGADVQILENNTSIPSQGKPVTAFCSPDFLKKLGLQPIPFQEMGPRTNRWVKN